MRILRMFAAAVLLAGAASAAVAKPAIIYRDPDLLVAKPLEHGAAFVVWDAIDIHDVVQEYIRAFKGDYAGGEKHTREALADCLAGRRALRPPSSSLTDDTPVHLGLADLFGAATEDSVRAALAVPADSLGVATLAVSRPEALRAMLAAAHAPWLIVIRGLRLEISETATAPMMMATRTGPVVLAGGKQRWLELTGQVIVVDADSLTVRWNGFLTGSHGIGGFRKSSTEGVAAAFAAALQREMH